MKIRYALLAAAALAAPAFAQGSVTVSGTIDKICSITIASPTSFSLGTTAAQALPDFTAKSNDPSTCATVKVNATNSQFNGGQQSVQYKIHFGSPSLPTNGALTFPNWTNDWNPMFVNSPNQQGILVNDPSVATTGYVFHWTIALLSTPYVWGTYAETFTIDIG